MPFQDCTNPFAFHFHAFTQDFGQINFKAFQRAVSLVEFHGGKAPSVPSLTVFHSFAIAGPAISIAAVIATPRSRVQTFISISLWL